jgi:hypothetical protein
MTTALAFYKGKGTWVDAIIRLVTRSRYSHVEYIQSYSGASPDAGMHHVECWSSSSRDGGVRKKQIDISSGNWDVVETPFHNDDMRVFFNMKNRQKYDYLAIVFSQFLSLRWQSDNRWFCSEICALAVGLEPAETFSPGSLKLAVEKLAQIHNAAKA